MWLPRWLYEGLPAIYVAAGGAALALFGHSSPAAVSAFLLFLAALMVAHWRRASRRAEEVFVAGEPVAPRPPPSAHHGCRTLNGGRNGGQNGGRARPVTSTAIPRETRSCPARR
jgi:hypothetical protein